MKKTILTSLLCTALTLLSILPATAQREVVRLTRYEGDRITGVIASSAFEVELIRSDTTRAVVEISPELETNLRFSLDEEGVLRVSLHNNDNNDWRFWQRLNANKDRTMKLKVWLPTLTRLEAGGAVRMSCTGDFKSEWTQIRVTGAAKLRSLTLSTSTLIFNGSGAGQASLTATAEIASIDVSSAFDGTIALDCQKATIDASSAAELDLTGQADETSIETSSAASVDAYNFSSKQLKAKASSASSIRAGVTESLDAKASSAASIRYRGTPASRNTDSSSSGSVRRVD